ncbi:uncharacterized protein N7525_009685 [Penicillium rubens]|uniref:uncharacterized protein n=1 Tax=Penicillium rubens TaxID=1108849 RepID=UPI002A59DABD|nr:uncharacterized protein N7525_009685 [Penicillium rubens]KAJ5831432.1 hypothetical protein N7525_009685 [Penicillium rubens]
MLVAPSLHAFKLKGTRYEWAISRHLVKQHDIYCRSCNGAATKVVGEVKKPWAPEHVNVLREGVALFENGQEHIILGQVARYMKDLNVRHAQVRSSTYKDTMFLRKV